MKVNSELRNNYTVFTKVRDLLLEWDFTFTTTDTKCYKNGEPFVDIGSRVILTHQSRRRYDIEFSEVAITDTGVYRCEATKDGTTKVSANITLAVVAGMMVSLKRPMGLKVEFIRCTD